jgi:hypothetical protein
MNIIFIWLLIFFCNLVALLCITIFPMEDYINESINCFTFKSFKEIRKIFLLKIKRPAPIVILLILNLLMFIDSHLP